jgi:enoyl-CoA hydratase
MADYSKFQHLKVENEDGLFTVTLNRPNSLNAINPPMHTEITEIWPVLSNDPEVRAVVLTGAGRAFCAGGDIKSMAPPGESMGSGGVKFPTPESTAEGARLVYNILDCQRPIVAAINGDAMGLGATLALFCDVTVAAETARIADTHVSIGVVAGDGGAVIWPWLIGPNRAKEFLMRGARLTGAEAAKIGLVNYALPTAEVLPKAREIARELADGPAWAIRWTKVSVNKLLKEAVNEVLDTSLALEIVTFNMPEHKEAAAAFVEKRKPNFRG